MFLNDLDIERIPFTLIFILIIVGTCLLVIYGVYSGKKYRKNLISSKEKREFKY